MINESLIPKRIGNFRVSWADFNPERFWYPPCLLCGSPNYSQLASLVINWSEFFIVECSTCHLIWRTPFPDSAFLNSLYSERYYEVDTHSPEIACQVGIADSEPADQRRRKRKSYDEIQMWSKKGITPKDQTGEPRKLLEIGGGRGYLQAAAQKAGWSTVGIEISPHGIKEAINKGLMILPVPLEQLCDTYVPYRKYFDLAVFFDFIEHVTDPGRILRMISNLLVDEGTVILRIPNTQECPRLHLIDHIWHFSESTLQLLMEREGFSGFESWESGIFKSPDGDVIQNISVRARKTAR